MQFGHLTLDFVNVEFAKELAAARNVDLQTIFPRDDSASIRVDGFLLDLDSWLPDAHDLARWLANPHSPMAADSRLAALPLAVHSYRLGLEERSALRRHGISASPRLNKWLFRWLVGAAQNAKRQSQGTVASALRRATPESIFEIEKKRLHWPSTDFTMVPNARK